MSEVSKNELKYDNSVSFPNNNAGAITPSDLRAFNVDLIDSTVNQTLYNTDSASLYWKIEDADSSINSLQIFTASQDDVNATLASTGSNTFVGNQTIEGDVVISYDGVSVTLNASTLNNGLAIDSNLDVYGNITSIGNLDIDGTLTASLQAGYVWLGGLDGTVQAVPSSSLIAGGTTDVIALNEFTASQQIINSGYNAFTASQQLSDTQLNSFTSSQESKNTTLGSVTASLQGQLNSIGNQSGSWVTESETGSFARVDVSNIFTATQNITGDLNVNGTISANTIHTIIESASVIFSSGSNILGDSTSDIQTFNGTVVVSGSQQLTGSLGLTGNITLVNGNGVTASHFRAVGTNGILFESNNGTDIALIGGGGGNGATFYGQVNTNSISASTINGFGDPLVFSSSVDSRLDSIEGTLPTLATTGSNIFNGNQTITGSLTTTNSINGLGGITGSISATNGVVSGSTQILNYNIFSTTGSNIFNGNQTITGSLLVNGSTTTTGSVNGNVVTQDITSTTASLDFGSANFFELTLVNGANTRVEATNVRKGQTVNVLVKQPATTGDGTISFSSNFDFPEIAPYTATTGPNSKDIITFITFSDTSSIYSAGVNNLI